MLDNINLGAVQSPYLQRKITIPPYESHIELYVYDSFNVLNASADDVLEVTFGGAAVQSRFSSGMGYKLSQPVTYVQLFNTSNIPLEVEFSLAVGDVTDNRLTVSGTVYTQSKMQGYGRISAGSMTAPQEIAYDNDSVVALVCTSGKITVNIAATDITVTDLELAAGQSWEMPIVTGSNIQITGTGKFNYSIVGY